jgi:hypothetical protein
MFIVVFFLGFPPTVMFIVVLFLGFPPTVMSKEPL